MTMRGSRPNLLVGSSPVMIDLRTEVERVARSDAKVLITGESGTGKELVAQAVHNGSARAERPFVAVNCAGLSETLLETELFGHVKGSFTGAYRDKLGKLELADRGTMFLDEIGEMTLRMQGLLLRFLETGELQKVGADRVVGRVNVRVIAATNRNLREMIGQGTFPRGSVLPAQRHSPDRAAAARSTRGHSLADQPFPRPFRRLRQRRRARDLSRGDAAAHRLSLARKRPRARERRRACRGHESRRDDPGRRPAARNPAATRDHVPPQEGTPPTVADDLYLRLLQERESFWTVVYPLYMQREITRSNVRDLVRKGLEEARGNYKIVARLFNMEQGDYKRFLNFLRKHDCQVPFKEYRS